MSLQMPLFIHGERPNKFFHPGKNPILLITQNSVHENSFVR